MRLTCKILLAGMAVLLAGFHLAFAEDAPAPVPTPPPATEQPKPTQPVQVQQAAVQPAQPVRQPAPPAGRPSPRHMPSQAEMLHIWFPGMGLEDPNKPRWDMLPLGMEKNFLTRVPVGGVENPAASDFPFLNTINGWNVEDVMQVSAEQVKSLQALRQEYEAEKEKLSQELADFDKAEVEKLRALRQKYEQKANDLLPENQREVKVKLDALREELVARKKPLAENLNKDAADLAAASALRVALAKIAAELEGKLLDLIPADAKTQLEPVIKKQAANREDMINRLLNRSMVGMPGKQPGPNQTAPAAKGTEPPAAAAGLPAAPPSQGANAQSPAPKGDVDAKPAADKN